MSQSPYARTDRELLTRIGRSAGEKAGYKQLVRELGLGGGRERRLLVEQLTRMVARGELVQMSAGLWGLPKRVPREVQAGAVHSSEERASTARGGAESVGSRSGRDQLLSGRLDLHRDGFGFVRPESGGSRAGSGSRAGEDVFIPPNEINGAMQGDLVLVDEAQPGRDGRRSGRIARVLTRRNPTVVGIFHYAGKAKRRSDSPFGLAEPRGNYVTPLDERIGGAIEIPEGAEVVAAPEVSPHRMLGDEAREQKARWEVPSGMKDSQWPLEGLAVDVELTSFPQAGRAARGRVIEVLGPPDAFGVDVEIVIRKHHLPHTFPAAVLAEASEQAAITVDSLPADEMALREDFRGLPIITIDGETARDFDDAVLVRPLPNGNTELQVHIADVGWYVQPGSALDTEARVRGTSVYFPDRAVPMLPHALSSGMCSLRPDEERLVLSCVMEVDARGEIVCYRVTEGVIRSVRRMTYTSVQACLNAGALRQGTGRRERTENREQRTGSFQSVTSFIARERTENREQGTGGREQETESVAAEPVAEDIAERERVALEQPELPAALDAMLELALRLNAKRVRRGSIDFDLPEPIVEFDPDGNMKAIVRSERGWAHRLIEEFMLSANECVATWLESQRVPSIYRIHEMPDPKRIVEFEETAASFGHSLGVGSLPVRKLTMKTDRRDSRKQSARGHDARGAQQHEIPQSIPVTPQMYQRLVRKIAGTSEERILAYLMLRSLKQARYAEKNEGHFALASPSYTHFTSPIRRYPDLIVHRLLRAMLRSGADPRGGAIHSGDKQPWGEAGAHRAGVQRPGFMLPGASHQGPATRAGKATPERAKRTGRVGWSADTGSDVGNSETHEQISAAASEIQGSFAPLRMTTSKNAGGPDVVPVAAEELNDIAVESSQAERRAADAERELIEWKKMRFMADKVGDDFRGVILSVTKYGFFVELEDMFIEGMVPLGSLVGDHYAFRDTDRTIVGSRTGHVFGIGQRVEVILDRIDRQQRRLQFALLPGTEPVANTGAGHASVRAAKSERKKAKAAKSKPKGRGARKK